MSCRSLWVLWSVVAATVLGTSGVGQKRVVVPSYMANKAGDGGTGVPLHNYGFPFDTQCLFDVQPTMAGLVRAMAFRRGFDPRLTHDVPPITIELEVGMSHSPISKYRATPYLPAHRGRDYNTVFARRKITFLPVPGRKRGPYPFTYVIVFDRPFLLRSGRTAMWEIRVENSSLKATAPGVGWDGVSPLSVTRNRGLYTRRNIGRSCGPGTGSNRLYAHFVAVGTSSLVFLKGPSVFTGRTFSVTYAGTRMDRWGPIKLPLDLGRFGAPGCAIYVSLDEALPSVWLFSFSFSLLEVPDDARVLGKKIYLQALVFNPANNSLHLEVSQGIEALIGPKEQIVGSTVVSPFPNAELSHVGVWGIADIGSSAIFELRY